MDYLLIRELEGKGYVFDTVLGLFTVENPALLDDVYRELDQGEAMMTLPSDYSVMPFDLTALTGECEICEIWKGSETENEVDEVFDQLSQTELCDLLVELNDRNLDSPTEVDLGGIGELEETHHITGRVSVS